MRNPELLRNIWLELSPQRLIAMPAILGLIFLAAYLAKSSAEMLPVIALLIYTIVTMIWGSKLAGDSIGIELDQGTWDTQRMSGLSPWSMAVGKLLGGPVFAWYGGAICAAVGLAAMPTDQLPFALKLTAAVVASTVSMHALALLVSLSIWSRQVRTALRTRSRGAGMMILFFLLVQTLFRLAYSHHAGNVLWYGRQWSGIDFVLLCSALAAFWTVFGLYRAMREELAFRDAPLGWLAFLLFCYAFSGGWFYGTEPPRGGLLSDQPQPLRHLAVCTMISSSAAYLLLFMERKDWLRLRRLAALWKAHERRRAFGLMPKWLATVALSAATTLAFCISALAAGDVRGTIAMVCTALAALALLARDGCLVLGLNFTRDQRRADAAAMLYLGVLYLLLPALLKGLKLGALMAALFPPLVYQQPVWLVAALFQAAAAMEFALARWRKLPP